MFVVEIIVVTTEVLRDVEILEVEPERHNLAEIVVEAIQGKVLDKVVQFVFFIKIGLDKVSGIVGVDHVAVDVVHVDSGKSCELL